MPEIGKSAYRIDAAGKVTGKTLYPGDLNRPGQAYMKILFANRPHAIVKRIDTSRAEALSGVIAVYTAKDVPVNEYGLGIPDQPVLCGPGSARPYADRVRFVGDQVALVVAETEEIAAQGRDLIAVEYEDLPLVIDPDQAMLPDAFVLHPDHGSNVLLHYKIRKGDIEEAFRNADVIVEGEYRTPAQEHAYLQPEAGMAYLDDQGRITVEVAGQWTHEDQEQIAHSLGLPLDQVRVIYPAIGGAFGGREDMSVQIVLALAVWRLAQRGIHRAVKIVWTREESIIGHHKRHPYILRAKWGATRDGKITAASVDVIADGGAYAYTSPKVLGNATIMCTGPYEIPNVRVDSYAVYTNHVPNGAFRGFGGPQGAFAAEQQLNRIAEVLGMDPVEIRRRNVLHGDALLSVGTPLPKGSSMPEVIEECARAAHWHADQSPAPAQNSKVRGRGFACAFKNIGFSFGYRENCTAQVELLGTTDIEKAIVYHAGADVGQGAHTVMAQMAAEALEIPLERVEMRVSDTFFTGNAGSTSASRMTYMSGNSIRGACLEAIQKWRDEERPVNVKYTYYAPPTTPLDKETGYAMPNFAYGYVAQAVDVEVDLETGHVTLLNVVCANDVGKALNPQQIEGQIEGAVVQAAGYTVLENFVMKDGYVLTPHLSTYLIPTVLDVPDKVESVILEFPDPNGPWGARGMAEMPFLPLAPAVTAAIHQATGVWFNEFPLTPDRVLRGLGKI